MSQFKVVKQGSHVAVGEITLLKQGFRPAGGTTPSAATKVTGNEAQNDTRDDAAAFKQDAHTTSTGER